MPDWDEQVGAGRPKRVGCASVDAARAVGERRIADAAANLRSVGIPASGTRGAVAPASGPYGGAPVFSWDVHPSAAPVRHATQRPTA